MKKNILINIYSGIYRGTKTACLIYILGLRFENKKKWFWSMNVIRAPLGMKRYQKKILE